MRRAVSWNGGFRGSRTTAWSTSPTGSLSIRSGSIWRRPCSPARLLLDPAYNVAYWNLHARELTEQDGSYFSEGRPLGFFHYSGYDPTKPDQLSKHQTRNRIIRGSALDKLLAEYRELLFAAGYERSSKYRYRLSTFSDGTRLSPLFRRLYASLTPEQQQRLGNPFQVDAEPSFFRWALQPVGKRPGPFFELILRQRPEIAASYPDPLGRHKSGFRTWLERVGANEMGFEPALARYLDGNAEEAVPQRPVLPCGVNLCGYIRNETGLGRVARGFAQSLRAAELPYSLIDVSHMSVNRSQDRSLTDDGTKDEYSIGLMVVNADQTVEVMRELGPERFAGKYNIGFWNWELPEFPRQWRERLDLFDEIWMGSRFGAEAVQRLSKTPVRVVLPPLYRSERGDRERGRQLLKAAANDYVFLTIFDFHSYAERKNPRGLIEAFKLAFPQPDNARLVIKCVNEQSNQVEMEALRQLAVGVRVDFLSGYLEAAQVDDLMAGCDAYVSLHRSEGIGLTLSDAMSAGKPTIATGWSGNMEFMTEQTSLLVRYRLVKLEANVGPYEAGSTWAEPDLSHAAELMQQLASDPESGRRLGAAARQYMQTEFGLEASASRVGERLRAICAITADPETTWRPRDLSWLQGDATMSHMDDQYSLDRQDGLIRVPYLPEFDSKSSLFGPVGRIVKRAVTFLTAYHTYYQKRVNISFISFMRESAGLHEKQVESSQEMEQQLDELKARVASLEKELARRNG